MTHQLLKQLKANHAAGHFHEPAGDDDLTAEQLPVRLLAFYLPQFHPTAENDGWWGTGFTEWTNVTKALPRFRGHYQPRLPADMGFYDLRLAGVLDQQARLARRHGIHGFCFYYYWFGGRRILERPLELLLAHSEIDLPFCVSWANENWTRTWDGGSSQVLLAQQHSAEDDVAFIDSLLPAFRDPRYIRVDGRPLLLVYRPSLLPDARATVARWRERLIAAGIGDPFVVMTRNFDVGDPRPFGMDAAAEFPPHNCPVHQRKPIFLLDPEFRGDAVEYEDVVAHFLAAPAADYPVFRGVMPSWDNIARRPTRGRAFRGATPPAYGEWLAATCRRTIAEHRPEERFVFVNAWNEWGEGAYLEPDRHNGHAYLRTTARVLRTARAEQAEEGNHSLTRSAPRPAPPRVSVRVRAARVLQQQHANAHNAVQRLLSRTRLGTTPT